MNLFRFIPLFLLSAKNKQNIIFRRVRIPKFEFNEKIMMETVMITL
jgi:hypothetical protein